MEYSSEHRDAPRPRADARRMSPLRRASCVLPDELVVENHEYDDGNGMYINNGVSPCGQKNCVVTIPCP